MAVLSHFNGHVEAAAEALLEDSLPASIQHLPRDLPSSLVELGQGRDTFSTPSAALPPHAVVDAAERDPASKCQSAACPPSRRQKDETIAMLDDHSAIGRKPLRGTMEEAMFGTREGNIVNGDQLAMYDDDFDDSFGLPGARLGASLHEGADALEAAVDNVRAGRVGQIGTDLVQGSYDAGGGRSGRTATNSGPKAGLLPTTSMEWIRAIGLGQYAQAMRNAGMVRLELASRLTETDCDRLGIAAAHRSKLLAAADNLAKRLQKHGRDIQAAAPDASGYASATAIHYDAETGTFWGEDGSTDMSVTNAPHQGGSDAPQKSNTVQPQHHRSQNRSQRGDEGNVEQRHHKQAPSAGNTTTVERQRKRAEQNKAKVANHNRKAQAYRKVA